jgi:D-glycero-alpha-D-manno-heptose-7-phosphate kinase
MIISQTPYRVSFAGGGTDLPAYYRQGFGAVLSVTIDQHIYVTLHRRFESTIRVSYSRTEVAPTIDDVQHELVREAMRMVEIDEPLEITTIGDVPAGTGMGSSSSLTVGLLTALYGYRHRIVSPKLLAEQACRIEIDILGKPIGRQDQYAAAFGGLNYVQFNSDDTVDIEPVPCRAETLAELEQRALLVYTGQTRDANLILEEQSRTAVNQLDVLRAMRDLANEMRYTLAGDGDLVFLTTMSMSGTQLPVEPGPWVASCSEPAVAVLSC